MQYQEAGSLYMNTYPSKKIEILLYGINSITEQLLRTYPFATLATTTSSSPYKDQTVINLDELKTIGFENIKKIIICSMFVDEIVNLLLDSGCPIEKINFYNISSDKIVNCATSIVPRLSQDETLYITYDLSSNVPCFDALSFAAVAEAERVKRSLKSIHFVIVPKRSLNNNYFFNSNYSEQELKWRLNNIVIPIFDSLPAATGVTVLQFREDCETLLRTKRNVFPSEIGPNTFVNSMGLRALYPYLNEGQTILELKTPDFAQQLVQNFIASYNPTSKKILTFTLRNSQTHEKRNSNLDPWIKFINSLDKDLYLPVIIRDTSDSTRSPIELTDTIEFPAASINFHVRIALYDKAYINFASSATGPSFSYYFIKDCSSIRYVPINDKHVTSTKETIQRAGIPLSGEQPYAKNGVHQVLLYQENFNNILSSFTKQIKLLQGGYVNE
ncbi:hypothetical protein [Marinomonas sp. 2405UD68-3]|uniref:hypothetical protein n=1 Tax=Marinomonas sp. 2405UD68-3 TaxID=3391835 RepID=UPI0039C9D4C5